MEAMKKKCSYTLLLERLVELGCVLKSKRFELKWLDKKIELMLSGLKKLIIKKQLPSFNDSSLS